MCTLTSCVDVLRSACLNSGCSMHVEATFSSPRPFLTLSTQAAKEVIAATSTAPDAAATAPDATPANGHDPSTPYKSPSSSVISPAGMSPRTLARLRSPANARAEALLHSWKVRTGGIDPDPRGPDCTVLRKRAGLTYSRRRVMRCAGCRKCNCLAEDCRGRQLT